MDVSGADVARLAVAVGAVLPAVAARVPPAPAAALGRLGAADEPGPHPLVGRSAAVAAFRARMAPRGAQMAAGPVRVRPMPPGGTESPLLAALGELSPLVVERLLGALELAVPGLRLADVPDLAAYLGTVHTGRYAFVHTTVQSEAVTAAGMVEQLCPGVADLVGSLCGRLVTHDQVRRLLAVGPGDETSVAAGHGAAHLALAVATAAAVVGQAPLPDLVDRPAAVVGLAVGAAAMLLRAAPMPAAYEAALLDKVRAEYLLPRHTSGTVPVSGHRFALTEGEVPAGGDFDGNGLLSVVDGGVLVRTGAGHGTVRVIARVLAEPPELVDTSGWDEVVEVSWRASRGSASVVGPDGGGDPQLRLMTPPWPGDYRLRVHARGRDDPDEAEEIYELLVWAAPPAPQVVHLRTDLLGHRLRGEPEPARAPRPEAAYRWLRRGTLADAATITVVTGARVEQVLEAFGANPARPEPMREIALDLAARGSIDPWVAALDAGDAVVAVEYNGFQGASESVLVRASAHGRAASLYWSVNADRRLSFAEGGRLLAAFEPPATGDLPPTVAAALTGLDFEDVRDRNAKGLVAVQRFTGHAVTADDVARIEAAGTGFRIAPQA
ncbi:DUF6461 domain-containing protein [Phytohabitans houttuyneae]|uniref:Uncharacterized protein n=1 Tax=Phytohabitans houttuyneae TaxID=1076126 RepID=A0A6V8KTR0_9ACTN|nr:hypothetical protein Phou_081550 [Phytohabitans houttuyneae]